MTRPTENTRREFLGGLGVGAIALVGFGLMARSAAADEKVTKEAIAKLIGKAKPKEGRVSLDVPQIAENGNTVPISVSVESPMTEKDYVKTVHLLADDNPNAEVATFRFTPASGLASASTRMRLAKTQNVIAIAEMSDGSFYQTLAQVKVTIGGCGG